MTDAIRPPAMEGKYPCGNATLGCSQMVSEPGTICLGPCNCAENNLRTAICAIDDVRHANLSRLGELYVITLAPHNRSRWVDVHALHLAIAEIMHKRGPYSLVIV